MRALKLSALLMILSLNGCALYDAYFMTGFDNNEYLLITQIRTDASVYKTQCDTPLAETHAIQLAYKTTLFQNYSKEIPRNDNLISSSKNFF